MSYRGNKYVIGLFVLLALSSVFIVDASLDNDAMEASTESDPLSDKDHLLPLEQGVFDEATVNRDYGADDFQDVKGRDLDKYYANRAFHGAPPSIPHKVEDTTGIGGKTCLQCHQSGGYVPKFEAFAPVTPHPDFINCRQCHVPQLTDQLFKPTNWEHPGTPQLQQRALQGSPPVIPHNVHLRENCQACHTGPAAVSPIKVSHPERTNCQQCHAKGSIERSTGIDIWDRNDTNNQSIIRY